MDASPTVCPFADRVFTEYNKFAGSLDTSREVDPCLVILDK
jgi:hypothetical protein